jgi:hypothetical protein
MALQTGLFKFTGKLDNVIGYRRNGKFFFRSMPEKVRQTAATRRAARRFGMTSRKGKLIRHALRPHLDLRHDGTLVNRLNKLLLQSDAGNLQVLQNFHFNKHTGLEKLFPEPPVVTDDGTLHIPAQKALLPQGRNTHIEVRLIAVRINFTEHRIEHTDVSSGIIDLSEPFNGMALSVSVAGKGTLLVTLQYRAFTKRNGSLSQSGDRRYMAADIIRVVDATAPVQSRSPLLRLFARSGTNRSSASVTARNRVANGSSAPVIARSSEANGSSVPVIARSSEARRAGRRSNLQASSPTQLE